MPNIKSAKKRVLTAQKRTLKNRAAKSELRTSLKKANVALETGADNAGDAVKVAIKQIDQAAAKGLIHKKQRCKKKIWFDQKIKRNRVEYHKVCLQSSWSNPTAFCFAIYCS